MKPTTKSESAKLIAAGRAMESFQHQTLGHFNVTLLRMIVAEALKRGKLQPHKCRFADLAMVDGIEADAFSYLVGHREVDDARCRELTDAQLEEPLIFLSCPAGSNGSEESQLLVDGIHRLVERKRRGLDYFRFYLLPLELAPRVEEGQFRILPWGEMEVTEEGLVPRRET